MPDARILMIECSHPDKTAELPELTDGFVNLYPDDSVRSGPHKALGEAKMMAVALNLKWSDDFDLGFKLSGRYSLLPTFDPETWATDAIAANATSHCGDEGIQTFAYSFAWGMRNVLGGFFISMLERHDPACMEISMFRSLKPRIRIRNRPMGVLAKWSSYNHQIAF